MKIKKTIELIRKKFITGGFKFFTKHYMDRYVDQFTSLKTKDQWGDIYIKLDRSVPSNTIDEYRKF